MKTISREEYETKYGASSVMKLEQLETSRQSKSTIPSTTPKDPVSNRFTEAIGLKGATDVFGSLLARQGLGEQTKAQGQEFVEAPTGTQIAGAVAQTAAIPAGAVLTGGGSLAGQMAVGAGLGYAYDVGGSFAEGEDSFAPGAETLAGAAVPPVLRGGGALIRGAGTLLARSAPTPPGAAQVAETVSDTVTPIKRAAKEYAINRPARLVERVGQAVEESRDLGKVYDTAPQPVKNAIDASLDMRFVNAVTEADDATKAGYKQIVEIAEQGSDKLGVKPRPEIVAGNAAADQYGILNAKRSEVGSQIGEAIDSLPSVTYDAAPLYQEVDGILSANGITPQYTSTGVKLDFTGSNIPPKQRTTIEALYGLLTETGDNMTARQLYNKDRLLSQLQREARFDGVSDIMVKTPEGQEVDLFRAMREVFSAELEGVAPSIKPLNQEYAQLRGLQDDIESSIFKSGNYQGTRDIDPAEFAQTNLRRLFSDAQSAADYRKIYDNLDAYSRVLGYKGARADDLAAFAVEMRKLYPDSVPPTSATGIWGGAVDTLKNIVGAGKADIVDQQKALRGLLDIPDSPTPASRATSKSLQQRTQDATKVNSKFERATDLTPENASIEAKAFKRIEESEQELLAAYKAENGNIINTDDFRKLFAEDGYAGHNAASVQEPSSYLSKKAYTDALQNPEPVVSFTAGGSGTGKSSALKGMPEISDELANSAAVLDSNLSSYGSATKKINEALDAGKEVIVDYVYRDPLDSFENGVVKRMFTNASENGRLVPSKVVAGNHIDSLDVARRLQEDGIPVRFVDNSNGPGKAKMSTFEAIANKANYPSVEELTKRFNEIAKRLLDEGTTIDGKFYQLTPEQYAGYIE